MKIDLRAGEVISKEGTASLQKGWEALGGKLYLTNFRLVFQSHKYNITSGVTEIERSQIKSCEKCWTRVFNLIPVMPNSIAIRTVDDQEFKFVVFKRSDWKKEIEK